MTSLEDTTHAETVRAAELAAAQTTLVGPLLFHWSPTNRHNNITHQGLVPGSPSIDGLWEAPYVSLCDSPSAAWALSGGHPRGQHHPTWDLWMVNRDHLNSYGIQDAGHGLAEVRAYDHIDKNDIWYVATRTNRTNTT